MRKERTAPSPDRIIVTGDDVLEMARIPVSGTVLGDFAAACRVLGGPPATTDDVIDLISAVSAMERLGVSVEVAALTARSFRETPPGAPERNGHFAGLATACRIVSLAGCSAPVRIVPTRTYAEILSGDGAWCGMAPGRRAAKVASAEIRGAVLLGDGALAVAFHSLRCGDTVHIGAAVAYGEQLISDDFRFWGQKSPEVIALGVASMLRRMKKWLI